MVVAINTTNDFKKWVSFWVSFCFFLCAPLVYAPRLRRGSAKGCPLTNCAFERSLAAFAFAIRHSRLFPPLLAIRGNAPFLPVVRRGMVEPLKGGRRESLPGGLPTYLEKVRRGKVYPPLHSGTYKRPVNKSKAILFAFIYRPLVGPRMQGGETLPQLTFFKKCRPH